MAKRWWRRTTEPDFSGTVPDFSGTQPGSSGPGWEAGAATVPPALVAWAQVVDTSQLSQSTVDDIDKYLRTYQSMTLAFSKETGFRLRAAVEAQVSPPPPRMAFSLDILATVVTVRRKQLGIG